MTNYKLLFWQVWYAVLGNEYSEQMTDDQDNIIRESYFHSKTLAQSLQGKVIASEFFWTKLPRKKQI